MITFEHDFRKDLERVIASIDAGTPFALVRFGDGEGTMLRQAENEAPKKVQGVHEAWDTRAIDAGFRKDLEASLVADLPGYCIGISCVRCDTMSNRYYREKIQVPEERWTFAELFGWANYDRAHVEFARILRSGACLVTCGPHADYEIPPNLCVIPGWSDADIIGQLLKEDRPVLVAAGPGACTLIHHYWKAQKPDKRVPIVDIGAVLDPVIHDGEISRCYQQDGHWGRTGGPMGPGEHQICRWHK